MSMRGLLAVAAGILLAGCTSTTNGTGSAAPGSSSPRSTPRSSGAAPTSSTPTSPTTSAPQGRHIRVTGLSGKTAYDATLYGSDDVTDCAAHAFGQQMITFLTQHPCRGAHRVIATVPLGGRTVALSVISTSFTSTDPAQPFAVTAAFVKLENADCSCGMSDLLREDGVIPGVSGGIPSQEAFLVLPQDTGVEIFDAWYVDGTTKDQDPKLVALEKDLFLSDLTRA